MRLLILSQHFHPETFRINEVCAGLAQRGHAVDVLTGQPNYPEGKTYDGYKGWRFGSKPWQELMIHRVPLFPRGRGGVLRLVLNYLSFVSTATLLGTWLLRGRKFDAIFVYATSPLIQAFAALWIGFLKKAPTIIWVQDLWPESLAATGYVRSRALLSLVRIMVRAIFRRSALILVQSPGFIAPVQQLATKQIVRYLPNPAETMFEEAVPVREIATAKVFTALFAGNIGAAQGIEVLLDAAQVLQNNAGVRIVIVGSGSRWQWMCDQVARRKLTNIELIGRRPLAEMPELFSHADALVVTLADEPILRLTVPSKLQAYLAVGRPIVASIAGESARLIAEAGAGIVVAPGDGVALASAIERLVAMPVVERIQYGVAGQSYYRRYFTMERVLETIEVQIQSVIADVRP